MIVKNQRSEPRYDAEIPVLIRTRFDEMRCVTTNVSFRGLFLRTAETFCKMQLVRIL